MLFENVQPVTVSDVPELAIAPLLLLVFASKTISVTLNVPLFWTWVPVTVIPLIDTVSPVAIVNITTAELPLMVNRFAPGPAIVRVSFTPLILITDAKVIVCGVLKTPASKTIVSAPAAAFASKTAWRKLPAPVLLVLVTVKVAAVAFIADNTSNKRAIVNVCLK